MITINNKVLFSFILLSFLMMGTTRVSAEVFYWKDAETNMSLTYPDRWQVRHNQTDDAIMTVYAPGYNDHAKCVFRVRPDQRYAIYPVSLSAPIQRQFYSANFWENYLGEYDDYVIQAVQDDAGLGRGFASFVRSSYTTAYGPKIEKESIAFASLYNNNAYIVECSAEKVGFARWYHSFLSVVKSVDFQKEIHEHTTGYYRDFLSPKLRIQGERKIDVSVY